MAKFKVNLADPATRKVQSVELDGPKAQPIVGRQVGDVLDGGILGFPGQKVRITGGSDKDGIPINPNVHGGGKKYVLLSVGIGFHPEHSGERRRKLIRGKMISEEIYQVNAVIIRGEDAKAASTASSTQPSEPPKAEKRKPKKAKAEEEKKR